MSDGLEIDRRCHRGAEDNGPLWPRWCRAFEGWRDIVVARAGNGSEVDAADAYRKSSAVEEAKALQGRDPNDSCLRGCVLSCATWVLFNTRKDNLRYVTFADEHDDTKEMHSKSTDRSTESPSVLPCSTTSRRQGITTVWDASDGSRAKGAFLIVCRRLASKKPNRCCDISCD